MSRPSHVRPNLVLAVCCLSLVIVGMDVTIVNVALPSIRTDLHASLSGLQWAIDGYTVVLAALLMLGGSTGDRLGRRRTFQTGLVLFTLGSLLCSVAPGLGWLVAFRMLQAVGGSMLNPVAMSIITNVFTDPRERARAIGVWGGVVGISLGLGPVVGGALIETVGWRGIFWINIPIGVAAFVLAALFVPESRAARPRRLDPVGQMLVIVALATVTYAIIESPRVGWTAPSTLALLAVSVAAVVGLVVHSHRHREPLLDVRFFRSVPFSGATVTAVAAFGAFGGFLFLNTLYLQVVRGYSPLTAGLCTLPIAAMTAVFAPVSGRLVAARGARIPLLAAGGFMTVGGVMLVPLRADTPLVWVLAAYAVFAVGFGLVNAPVTNSAVAGMPRSQAGVAAAIASTSRQVGATLGVAVIGSVLNAGLHGTSTASGFPGAARAAWWIVTGCSAAVFVLGLVISGARARATVSRVQELFGDERQGLAA